MARLRAHTVEVVGLLQKVGPQTRGTGLAVVDRGRPGQRRGPLPLGHGLDADSPSQLGRRLAVAVVEREELRELAGHHPVRRDLAP